MCAQQWQSASSANISDIHFEMPFHEDNALKIPPLKIKIKQELNQFETGNLKSYKILESFSCKFCSKKLSNSSKLKKHLKV